MSSAAPAHEDDSASVGLWVQMSAKNWRQPGATASRLVTQKSLGNVLPKKRERGLKQNIMAAWPGRKFKKKGEGKYTFLEY